MNWLCQYLQSWKCWRKCGRLDVCNCSYYFKCAHFNVFVTASVEWRKKKTTKWILNEFDKIFSKSDKLHPPVSHCYNCENFFLFSISSRIQVTAMVTWTYFKSCIFFVSAIASMHAYPHVYPNIQNNRTLSMRFGQQTKIVYTQICLRCVADSLLRVYNRFSSNTHFPQQQNSYCSSQCIHTIGEKFSPALDKPNTHNIARI